MNQNPPVLNSLNPSHTRNKPKVHFPLFFWRLLSCESLAYLDYLIIKRPPMRIACARARRFYVEQYRALVR